MSYSASFTLFSLWVSVCLISVAVFSSSLTFLPLLCQIYCWACQRHSSYFVLFLISSIWFILKGSVSLLKLHIRQYATSTRDFNLLAVVVVQLLSCVWLFVTPCTAACQASLSFTVSCTLLRLASIESEMPSNHLVLSPLPSLAIDLSPLQGLF